MNSFHQSYWLLLFFLYSFAGWIWESSYTSIRGRRWINRGFLHGPWIPIYGTGALMVLLVTLPVKDSVPLIFLFGIVGATALEYVTGAVMERMFHMRYWDYSGQRFNLNGYICLSSSLAWGVFSVLLVCVADPPVERMVRAIPLYAADVLSLVLVVLFVTDTTKSAQEAFDLKKLLEELSANHEHLAAMEQRLKLSVEQLNQTSESLRQRLRQMEQSAASGLDRTQAAVQQKREDLRALGGEVFQTRLEEWKSRESRLLERLSEKSREALSTLAEELGMPDSVSAEERSRLMEVKEMLTGLQAAVKNAQAEAASRRSGEFKKALSVLRRNPSAISKRYDQILKKLMGRKDL